MFFVSFLLGVAYFVTYWIITGILGLLIYALGSLGGAIIIIIGFIGFLLYLALMIAFMAFSIGCQASIYGTLSKNIEQQH
jgi:hypothetical protein